MRGMSTFEDNLLVVPLHDADDDDDSGEDTQTERQRVTRLMDLGNGGYVTRALALNDES